MKLPSSMNPKVTGSLLLLTRRNSLRLGHRGLSPLAAVSAAKVLLIPVADFTPWLSGMNVTHENDRFWWHVSSYEEGSSWFPS